MQPSKALWPIEVTELPMVTDVRFEQPSKAKGLIEKVGGKILGTVLNGVENTRGKYYYYYGTGEDGTREKRKSSHRRTR